MTLVFAQAVCVTALFLGGCQAHGKASGKIETSGSMSGDASFHAEGSTEANAEAPNLSSRIRLEGDRLEYEGDIKFKYNDDALERDQTFETLSELSDILKEHEEVRLHVEGHADSRGQDQYNLDLSDRRARSVRKWLVEQGIREDRLTAEGYGEDQKFDEPEHCRDKTGPDRLFEDQKDCLEVWASNRRTVFKVKAGLASLEKPQNSPEEPLKERKPEEPKEAQACRWPVGIHLNLLGPNSYAGAAIAVEPCVWWVELSLGAGYRQGSVDKRIEGRDASGDYTVWTVPLRGRFWFSPKYSSFLVDIGAGVAQYDIDATSRDAAGIQIDEGGSYRRPLGMVGVGYGYRWDGPFRLALLVGGVLQPQEIETFTELTDPRPYVEASLGYYF